MFGNSSTFDIQGVPGVHETMADIDVSQGIEKIGIFWFILSLLCAVWASLRSCHTIVLHLKNYRRPDLQRLTIRILLM
jgi:hypothetical protein